MSNELPAGRELDAAVARKLGYIVQEGPGAEYDGIRLPWQVWEKDGQTRNPVRWSIPRSNEDKAALLEVIFFLLQHDRTICADAVCWQEWNGLALFGNWEDKAEPFDLAEPGPFLASFALAVCRAALKCGEIK